MENFLRQYFFTYFTPKNIFTPIFSKTKLFFENFGVEKVLAKKNFGVKNIGVKNIGVKKYWCKKILV